MDEFEIMRQQMASLKSQLDRQEIVNKDLMRKIMKGKASWMNILVKSELLIIPFAFLLIAAICSAYGMSQWFSFTFLIFAGIDAAFDFRTVRIPPSLFYESTIVDLKKFLVRQKRERFVQTCVSGALCVIWLILFVYAMTTGDGAMKATSTGGAIGGVVGAIVATIVIIVLYRKMQHTNDQIISDIDSLENGN